MHTPHQDPDIHPIHMNIMPTDLKQLTNLTNHDGKEYYTHHNNLTNTHTTNLWKTISAWATAHITATLLTLTTLLTIYWTTHITNTYTLTIISFITYPTTTALTMHTLNKTAKKHHQQIKIQTYKKEIKQLLTQNPNLNAIHHQYLKTTNPQEKYNLEEQYYNEVEKHYAQNQQKEQDNKYYRKFQKELQQL